MTNDPTDFIIFYSWQSDLPEKTNKQAIRSAIRKASSNIEAELPKLRFDLDEATRNKSGSPNIPATILEKIKLSDVFVCDITTINSNIDNKLRPTPNPNVLFELGYAVSQLGWPRIVMLFNKAFGEFPKDTPFDIDRQRASPYQLSEADSKNKSSIAHLEGLLSEAIISIVRSDPTRPTKAHNKSPEEIRRLRDVQNVTWALSTIHIPTMDEMLSDLPHLIHSKVFHFWESYKAIVRSSLFHVYDETTKHVFFEVLDNWGKCIDNSGYYSGTQNPEVFTFSRLEDSLPSKERRAAWEKIEESGIALRTSFDNLLRHVRTEHLEIDLEALSKNAWKEYSEFNSQS